VRILQALGLLVLAILAQTGLTAVVVVLARLVNPQAEILPVALGLVASQILLAGVLVRLLRHRRRQAMGITRTGQLVDQAIQEEAINRAAILATEAKRQAGSKEK
jgi:hypothetical protein